MIRLALSRTRPCTDDNVKADRHQKLTFTVSLPDNTPCTAPHDSITDFFACRYPETIYREFIFAKIYNYVIIGNNKPLAVKRQKILVFVDLNSEKHWQHRPGKKYDHKRLWSYLDSWQKSVRESCSSLSTSSCEDLAAVTCRHTLHKAMLFLSVELLRLISSFQNISLLLFIKAQ